MSDQPAHNAESVFARFLAERNEDVASSFETWCERQSDVQASPDLAAQVARLHRAWASILGELEAPQARDVLASFFRPRARGRDTQRGESPEGALRAGQQISPFVLESFIAQGGMGQVWVAVDQNLRRQVALKLVLPGRVDLRSVELSAREARAGGRLAHPNIVTTLAHGSDGGLAWIAQELVEGSWTERRAQPPAEEGRRSVTAPTHRGRQRDANAAQRLGVLQHEPATVARRE